MKDPQNPIIYPESDYRSPLLQFNAANNWEAYDIQRPSVIMENGRRRIWFTGIGWMPGFYGVQGRIGYAAEPYQVFLPLITR